MHCCSPDPVDTGARGVEGSRSPRLAAAKTLDVNEAKPRHAREAAPIERRHRVAVRECRPGDEEIVESHRCAVLMEVRPDFGVAPRFIRSEREYRDVRRDPVGECGATHARVRIGRPQRSLEQFGNGDCRNGHRIDCRVGSEARH